MSPCAVGAVFSWSSYNKPIADDYVVKADGKIVGSIFWPICHTRQQNMGDDDKTEKKAGLVLFLVLSSAPRKPICQVDFMLVSYVKSHTFSSVQ